jgi:hypothetical protein
MVCKYIHLVFLDREPCLDGLLACPVFTMCLPLDKDCLRVDVAVPPESNGLGAFGFLESAKIQLQILVIEVYRRNGCAT